MNRAHSITARLTVDVDVDELPEKLRGFANKDTIDLEVEASYFYEYIHECGYPSVTEEIEVESIKVEAGDKQAVVSMKELIPVVPGVEESIEDAIRLRFEYEIEP